MACGILVPRPGTEPGPSSVKAWSPNQWTAREFPRMVLICSKTSVVWRRERLVLPHAQFKRSPGPVPIELVDLCFKSNTGCQGWNQKILELKEPLEII